MNALASIDIDLYNEYTGKEWDCFYIDENCDIFMEHHIKDLKVN